MLKSFNLSGMLTGLLKKRDHMKILEVEAPKMTNNLFVM